MMDAETWRVQLPTGELRAFSLDALDEAFDAGLIHGGTMVLAPGATEWAPLAQVAGLDAPDTDPEIAATQTPSLSPVAISNDVPSASFAPPAPLPLDLPDLPDDALKPKRGLGIALAGVGVAAVACAIAFVVPKLGATLASVHPDKANAANAMQAPPPAIDVTGDGYKPTNALTEEQKRLLLEADKKKEEDRKRREREAAEKARAKTPARRGKSSSPFVNGGDKYDPLNGAL